MLFPSLPSTQSSALPPSLRHTVAKSPQSQKFFLDFPHKAFILIAPRTKISLHPRNTAPNKEGDMNDKGRSRQMLTRASTKQSQFRFGNWQLIRISPHHPTAPSPHPFLRHCQLSRATKRTHFPLWRPKKGCFGGYFSASPARNPRAYPSRTEGLRGNQAGIGDLARRLSRLPYRRRRRGFGRRSLRSGYGQGT